MVADHVNGVAETMHFRKSREVEGINLAPDSVEFELRALNMPVIAVIEPRILLGQCLLSALQSLDADSVFKAYLSVEEWQDGRERCETDMVLLCVAAGEMNEAKLPAMGRDLALLQACTPAVRFAVMSEREDPDRILKTLEAGAGGYIPTSLSLEVVVQVLQLIMAGGVFVPASSLVAMATGAGSKASHPIEATFALSARQLSVARALRKGMPNKLIAYELNMCESTVKVHVRNIMRKLKAKNRTEAALLTNRLFAEIDK